MKNVLCLSDLLDRAFDNNFTLTKDEAKQILGLFSWEDKIDFDWENQTITIDRWNAIFVWE